MPQTAIREASRLLQEKCFPSASLPAARALPSLANQAMISSRSGRCYSPSGLTRIVCLESSCNLQGAQAVKYEFEALARTFA